MYSQMLKGIVDGCILSIISKNEVYGYELSKKLEDSGFLTVSEGSIYPILSRLQKDNLIKGVFKSSPHGPRRKYYSLTDEGKVALIEFTKKWEELNCAVKNVLNDK